MPEKLFLKGAAGHTFIQPFLHLGLAILNRIFETGSRAEGPNKPRTDPETRVRWNQTSLAGGRRAGNLHAAVTVGYSATRSLSEQAKNGDYERGRAVIPGAVRIGAAQPCLYGGSGRTLAAAVTLENQGHAEKIVDPSSCRVPKVRTR